VTVAQWGDVLAWMAPCFGLALAGTWLARRYALRHALVDQPGERRSHVVATPRGGGISIAATLLFAIAWLAVRDPAHARFLAAAAAGLALVAGVGWIDDHRPLPPLVRLPVQAVAAGLLAWGIGQEGGGIAAMACAFVAAMVLVNAWNFMDGIDGIATSQALLVALAYGLWGGPTIAAWLGFALAAACLGFLPFNLPKARIFLGDVGSGALGYALAVLAMLLALQDWPRAPVLLLPLSAFLIDSSLTLATRIVRGARWWLPHAEHAYQHWARRIRSHGRVTLAFAVWTSAASLFMFAAGNRRPATIMWLLCATSAAGALAWTWLRRGARRTGQGNME
jgi:UDP-N-acetylmuramyl pentapeptide phosphotransferase/UDP-N-acetylglucosamine-1-phosphate transferase